MINKVPSVVLIVALFLDVAACSRPAAQTNGTPLRSVSVVTLRTAPLDQTLHVVGLLAPKDEARLSFKVGGLIESLRAEEGQSVKAGQVLAELKQAEVGASVEAARQAADKAERDLARGKALLADGVATEEQVQDLTTAERVAAAALSSARFNAAHARIVAAGDGVVLRKLAEVNELVAPGQTVLVVGGVQRGWIVRVGLADRDVVRVHPGDAARIEFDAWPGRVFAGRVSNIASAADSATGTFTVELQLQAGDARFAQGLVAKVGLSPGDTAVVPVIPVSALVEANDREGGVFVATGTGSQVVVHRVTIQIGRMAGGDVEVMGGLEPGATVVADGAAFLENGESVRVASR